MERLAGGMLVSKRSTVKHLDFRYHIHDEPDALRIRLAGQLAGENVRSVYYAWRTALSIIGVRPVLADITSVSHADRRGRRLLVFWRRRGVQIIAASPVSRALAQEVLGEAVDVLPPPRRGWLQRLRQAGMAALARLGANASSQGKSGMTNAGSASVLEPARVVCRWR